MKYKAIIFLFTSTLSFASEQSCELNSNFDSGTEDNLNQIINHVDYSGSCIDKWSVKPNNDWKKNIDQMVNELPKKMKYESRPFLDMESMKNRDQNVDQFNFLGKDHPDLKKLAEETDKYIENYERNTKNWKEIIDQLKLKNEKTGSIPDYEKRNIISAFEAKGIKLTKTDIPTYDDLKIKTSTSFSTNKDAFNAAFQNAWTSALELKTQQAKKELTKIAENKMCVKGAEFKVEPNEGFFSENYTGNSDIEAARARLSATLKQIEGQVHSNTKFFCSPISNHYSKLTPVENKIEVELQGTTFFEDNKFELNKSQSQMIDKKIAEQTAKLKSLKPSCDVVIKKVDIFSSSSLLRNRININGAEDVSKSWDFKWLSEQRAKNFSDHLMKKHKVSNANISTHAKGSNGDGTSGPCPYYHDGKAIKVKSDLNLEKYKYVKV